MNACREPDSWLLLLSVCVCVSVYMARSEYSSVALTFFVRVVEWNEVREGERGARGRGRGQTRVSRERREGCRGEWGAAAAVLLLLLLEKRGGGYTRAFVTYDTRTRVATTNARYIECHSLSHTVSEHKTLMFICACASDRWHV